MDDFKMAERIRVLEDTLMKAAKFVYDIGYKTEAIKYVMASEWLSFIDARDVIDYLNKSVNDDWVDAKGASHPTRTPEISSSIEDRLKFLEANKETTNELMKNICESLDGLERSLNNVVDTVNDNATVLEEAMEVVNDNKVILNEVIATSDEMRAVINDHRDRIWEIQDDLIEEGIIDELEIDFEPDLDLSTDEEVLFSEDEENEEDDPSEGGFEPDRREPR